LRIIAGSQTKNASRAEHSVEMHSRALCAVERMTPHIVSDRCASRRIAFERWRVLDRALRFNDKPQAIVAVIAAGLRVICRRICRANVCEDLLCAIKAVGFN
jgi:hypothetical protein